MIWSAQTKNGFLVELICLSVHETYRGLLEGQPNEELNADIVQQAVSTAQKEYREWPVHLIPPNIRNGKYPQLPAFRCVGLFWAFVTKDPDMHASGSVLVWFQEKTIISGIDLSLTELDWWTVAKDFLY